MSRAPRTHRAAIWCGVFPPAFRPPGSTDAARDLAGAGGNIRGIALNAAFLAADTGENVRMTHILAAARSEYANAGAADFAF